ncbi:fimbria/pilus outer membrane usher protein [Paramixta manurensis]|uniref:fimbria/pilus outer membrane usher protein n=1 Tax=Paramixta manurensis TaxID=2740817 RepID=UPI003390F407
MAISCALSSQVAIAEENNASLVEFDPAFLSIAPGNDVDLSRFNSGANALPGKYRSDIYVNNNLITTEQIEIVSAEDKTTYPCLTRQIIAAINLDFEKLPATARDALSQDDQSCYRLEKLIPNATVAYDSSEQRLDIVIPQIFIHRSAQGSVSPALWDRGVPALMLGYNLNAYNQHTKSGSENSFYAGFNTGLNVGAWYFRHNGNYNWSENGLKKYTSINTYLQRDIPSIQGRLLVGQSNTRGQLFDSVPFSGVQIASDERMLPQSRRGYAPEIHGIARTNARVTVKQNNQVIYETTVTPGEFLINDLYPSGYGGDLVVTVKEADGSEQSFSVPFSSVTQLLRPGTWQYSVTSGRLRGNELRDPPILTEGTVQYGISNTLTGYTGMQLTDNYYAAQVGLAVDTPVGAVSFDVTKARAHINTNAHGGNSTSGESYKVGFNKLINQTNSNISLAAYRFSTEGYLDLIPALQLRELNTQDNRNVRIWRPKNRLTLTASQGLPGNFGQFYVTGSVQNYWQKDGTDKQYQLGYSNYIGNLSYSLNATKTWSNYGRQQTSYLLSFSLPLGSSVVRNAPQMRVDLSHDSDGRMSEMTSLNGTAGSTSQFSYGVSASHANQRAGTSGSANAQYRTAVTTVNGGWSGGKDYRSVSAGASGMAMIHGGGVTFSPYYADTAALVEAKGAEGAHVSGYPGIQVDSNGYAIVPYLNPYEMNEITIDPKGTAQGVELDNTSQKVAPYSGAVVKLTYNARSGNALLINASYLNKPLPFGAAISDSNGSNVGYVGQGGQAFVRVENVSGTLSVTWGDQESKRCLLPYQVPGNQKAAMPILSAVCTPVGK